MTSTVTTDFREEYEAERERMLRRRFLWYAGVVFILGLITTGLTATVWIFGLNPDQPTYTMLNLFAQIPALIAYGLCWWLVARKPMTRGQLLGVVFWLILGTGAFSLVSNVVTVEIAKEELYEASLTANGARIGNVGVTTTEGALPATPEPGVAASPESDAPGAAATELDPAERDRRIQRTGARLIVLGGSIGSIFVIHFFACLFIPWTPRESLKPIVPLLILNAVIILVYIRLVPVGGSIGIALSPLVAGPGMIICWYRNSRFRNKFHFKMLKGRYADIKQDLGVARQIHDAMFPDPLLEGPVRFEYRYEPMRQIGGDYLFARVLEGANGDESVLNLAIVDVTGHGIGAALTVNRLHGEIERLLGESESATPGELLTGLNSYLHLTLATHSVYATAIFLRFDPNENTLSWASAGHPPAFLKALDGTIDRLDSTTIMLGAARGEDFPANEQSTRFHPGDTLIAYTDGAIESRDDKGRMLGIDGLQKIIASGRPEEDGGWAASVLHAVEERRFGPAQDDTLMVEIYRPYQG